LVIRSSLGARRDELAETPLVRGVHDHLRNDDITLRTLAVVRPDRDPDRS
jgi:hypothetical protein